MEKPERLDVLDVLDEAISQTLEIECECESDVMLSSLSAHDLRRVLKELSWNVEHFRDMIAGTKDEIKSGKSKYSRVRLESFIEDWKRQRNTYRAAESLVRAELRIEAKFMKRQRELF